MMKNYIFKVLLMAISMTTVTVMNSMAAEQTKVTNEQNHPRSTKLRTTSVKLKKTTQSQKNQIVNLVVATKGIKSAYFKGNTIYMSYSPKRITAANAQMAAKNAYNKVVGKHGQNGNYYNAQPQPGRYGSTAPAPNNPPKPQPQPNNPPKPQPNNHGNSQHGNHQQGNNHNNYNPQPGRK